MYHWRKDKNTEGKCSSLNLDLALCDHMSFKPRLHSWQPIEAVQYWCYWPLKVRLYQSWQIKGVNRLFVENLLKVSLDNQSNKIKFFRGKLKVVLLKFIATSASGKLVSNSKYEMFILPHFYKYSLVSYK